MLHGNAAAPYSRRVDPPRRTTADLDDYPDLVVMYLGMRVEEPRGAETVERLAPEIMASVEARPDGLLLHEEVVFPESDPPYFGMRQYWRDFESLEAWANSLPHKAWWTDYLATAVARPSGTRRTLDEAESRARSSTSPTARSA